MSTVFDRDTDGPVVGTFDGDHLGAVRGHDRNADLVATSGGRQCCRVSVGIGTRPIDDRGAHTVHSNQQRRGDEEYDCNQRNDRSPFITRDAS